MSGQSIQLTADQLRRYARHLVLPEIGETGQRRLLASSALVIGAGGLGSNALMSLAVSGIGRLGIVEHDRVELSNLQRQLLFEEADIGRPKAEAARDRLEEMNSACRIDIFPIRLDESNAREYIKPFDIVLDGSDNFATRFAVHDACFHEKKPLVSAAISGFTAQLSTFKAYLGAPHPCYRCWLPSVPDRERNCAQEGIIGPLAGMIGHMQALEAMKELLGIGASLSGRMLALEALGLHVRIIGLQRDPACALCAAY